MNENKKSFATYLSLATTGGQWKQVDVGSPSPSIRVFEGTFPGENVTARLALDTEGKTYGLTAWRGDNVVLETGDHPESYVRVGSVPPRVAMLLSQFVFGAPNTIEEGLNVGDVVKVDGKEALVCDPDAPGDTVELRIDGKTDFVDKERIDESFLGISPIPYAPTIPATSIPASGSSVPTKTSVDDIIAKAMAGFDGFDFNAEVTQPVEEYNPIDDVATAESHINSLEVIFPRIPVADYARLAPRLQGLLNSVLSEGRIKK